MSCSMRAWQFDFDTVAADVADKLEQRHPHVFGDVDVPAPSDLNLQWEQRKSAEREHVDDHLPAQMPALMRAWKLQKRAAAVGFDWPDANGPKDKIAEELDELEQAQRIDDASIRNRVNEELGDLLFAVVNYARHLGVEPEQALRAANRKFTRRFRFIESRLSEQGLRSEDVDLEYLDSLWDEAKETE
jgi:nucleoside triphosphate diphosphatase